MAASKAIGFLNFKFSADLSGFDRAMKKAQKSLKKFGKNIQKTGQNLSRNLTLPILGLGAAALKFGSDLQETDSKFNQVFSSIQKEAQETAKVFKDSFGLSELAAKDMLSGTGDLLVGIGLTESGALDLSTKINELAVDLASFTNFSGGAKGASDALTKALLGERESIKSLGISITEADLKEFAADQGLVWKELDKGTRAMLTYELAAKQSFKAIGDFERTSGSFANQMRILQGDLVDVAAEMGIRLIPYAQAAIEKFKLLIQWFDGLSESTKDNIVKWGLLLAAIGPILIIIGKMSIGISALIPLFASLSKFVIANPYLVLGAAIAGVAYAIYEVATALDSQGKAQKLLNDISREASSKIVDQMAQIKELTGAIENETTSLDDKKKALNTLKELYPGYYEEVDEATFSQDAMKLSTDRLKGALMDLARLDVYTEKIKDLTSKQLELEEKIKENTKGQSTFQTAMGAVTSVLEESSSGFNILGRAMAGSSKESFEQTKELTELNKTIDDLINRKIELSKKTKDYNLTIKKVTHNTKDLKDETTDLTNDTTELTEETKKYDSSLDPLLANIKDYAENMTVAGASMEGVETWTRKLTLAQQLGAAGFQMFGDILTSSLDSALDSQENFFKLFIKNIKRAIRSLLIQLAVMTFIKALMGGGRAAFSLVSIKKNLGSIMNIPGLEDGGLITGPTTALIGEGVGTTASNPEVVAPLDKLKSMIGGGNQHITVTGKLIGNDIFLSNSKAGINRLRTV